MTAKLRADFPPWYLLSIDVNPAEYTLGTSADNLKSHKAERAEEGGGEDPLIYLLFITH